MQGISANISCQGWVVPNATHIFTQHKVHNQLQTHFPWFPLPMISNSATQIVVNSSFYEKKKLQTFFSGYVSIQKCHWSNMVHMSCKSLGEGTILT